MKKIVFFISIIFLASLVGCSSNNSKVEFDLSYDEFSDILGSFESVSNVTITEQNSSNSDEARIIKFDSNYIAINGLNDNATSCVFYEDLEYIYYFESDIWKRRLLLNDEIDYIPKFDFEKYIAQYSSFTYDKENSIYSLKKCNVDEDYSNIKITIINNEILGYSFQQNNVEYKYSFYDYNETSVTLPASYSDVYNRFSLVEWYDLLSTTVNIANFTSTTGYIDKIDEEIYEQYTSISRFDRANQVKSITIENSTSKYYHRIINENEEIYKYENEEWVLQNVAPIDALIFTQFDLLPIQILISNYDNTSFNEYVNSYTITNVSHENKNYSNITIVVENEAINHITMMYTYMLDDVLHNVIKVIYFTNINSTIIEE